MWRAYVVDVSSRVGRTAEIQGDPVGRPRGAPWSYACPQCDVIFYDGVDYTWCPVCSRPVDWVDLAKPLWCCDRCDAFVNEVRADWPTCDACACAMTRIHALESPPPPLSPSNSGGTLTTIGASAMVAVSVAQLVVLALDPLGFVVVAPLLVLAAIGASGFLIALFGSLGELRALVRDRRTRVIHGLEHACLKLLERHGCEARGGQTHDGFFEIEVVNDGRAAVHTVRQATYEAMTRLAHGEASLALDPRCGTSLMVGVALVSALIVGAAVIGFVAGAPPGILAASTAVIALLTWWASRPLGLLAQRTLTVSTCFASAAVQRIVRVVHASGRTATFLVHVHVQMPAMHGR